ncbi:MAG: sulfatase [Candidatus Lokiarchaeota archaeon]|nr:sulfatase [Candidatus Lokiarchaeota archaeon]
MQGNKPNFIIIISDTLRRDFLSCYNTMKVNGNPVDTRNIADFAKKCTIFENAYSASFPTVPHRHDVMAGTFSATYMPWAPLPLAEPVLQVMLAQQGYTTMMVCDEPHILENGFNYQRGFDGFEWIRGQEHDKWKTSPKAPPFKADPACFRNPLELQRTHMRGRAHWHHEADTFPARTASCACEWLEENYDDGPFYLYVDFFDPHEPWDAPRWYVDKYADRDFMGREVDYPLYNKTAGYLSPEEIEHCRALYAAEVTLVDRWAGRIFEKVDDLGLLDNTVIIFTTDHGFLLGEHGFIGKSFTNYQGEGRHVLRYIPLFEEINHIPLLIYHPDVKPCRKNAFVQPPDFAPTVMDIEGHPFLACQGQSFKEVLLGDKDRHRDFVASFPFLAGPGIPVSMVKDGWSAILVSRKERSGKAIVDRAVDGLDKTLEPWEEARDMLFDLRKDPRQQQDVSAQHPDVMAAMKRDLIGFLDELDVDKELLDGWKD